MLFHWNELSELDREAIHGEAESSVKEVTTKPREPNTNRMIYAVSRLTVIKWKLEKIADYKLSDQEQDEWAQRGEYFAGYESPEH